MHKWRRNARKGRARRVSWAKSKFCNHMYEQIYNTIVDNMPKSFEVSDTTVECIMRVVDSLIKPSKGAYHENPEHGDGKGCGE